MKDKVELKGKGPFKIDVAVITSKEVVDLTINHVVSVDTEVFADVPMVRFMKSDGLFTYVPAEKIAYIEITKMD